MRCTQKALGLFSYTVDLKTPANSFVALITFDQIDLQNVINLLSVSSVKDWGGWVHDIEAEGQVCHTK